MFFLTQMVAYFKLQEASRYQFFSREIVYVQDGRKFIVSCLRPGVKLFYYYFVWTNKDGLYFVLSTAPSGKYKMNGDMLTQSGPASVNIFQIIRDAVARMPNGIRILETIVELMAQ